MNRSSGVLMPMSSLPSPYGIGSMGKDAYKFIDFLHASGQRYWQLLPLGPTSYGDSPYFSPSTFAGNPYYIDLDMLIEDGLLTQEELSAYSWGEELDRVDYGLIYQNRFPVLRKAFARGREKLGEELNRFLADTPWLKDYALFMALKAHFGMKSWTDWPDEDIRLRKSGAVERYSRLLKDDVEFYVFLQYLFFEQWSALREYAREKSVLFIGDIPIYVALDSADVWSEPEFFLLDEDNLPILVSGCPPDSFTEDGQLWGNPLYDWDRMRADSFGWWIRRVEGAGKLYDVLRIDHFRGFESYWTVKYGAKTAKLGKWLPGPGMSLVGVLSSWFHNMEFIAEDLGYMTDEVKKLVSDSGFPGMRVMEFAFDAHSESDYLPHNCDYNSICYLGTHDNDTVLGWLETINKEDRDFARRYMHITEDEGWNWGMIRSGMATASKLFVVQMQDLLELPGECRMNIPGTAEGNWRWRMLPGALSEELSEKLLLYTHTFRRAGVDK